MDESSNIPKRVALYKQLLLAGVVLLLVIATIYVYKDRQAKRESAYSSSFNKGREAMFEGDMVKALPILSEAVRLADDFQQEARAKNSLGVSYLLSDNPSDVRQGIAILKEIVSNESYPVEFRGGAMHRILGVFLSTHDHRLAEEHIFTGEEPWRSFIKDGASFDETLRRAYAWLDDLSPSPGGKYALVQWYGEQLYIDKVTPGGILDANTKERYQAELLKHLSGGEELFPLILSYDELEVWEKSGNMFFRALAHMFAYLVFEEDAYKEKAEDSFLSAIQMQENLPKEYAPLLRSSAPMRYWYAFFLGYLTESKKENRKEEIARLLDPIVTKEAFIYLAPYLNNIKGMDEKSADMMAHIFVANTLAKNDDRFKERLREIGWEGL